MKAALSVIALVLLALILPFFLPSGGPDKANMEQNLPWQISVDEQGRSQVFGLTLGSSTLADVRQHLGQELEVAIIAAPDEVGSLEGYYAQLPLGFILGRLILTLEQDPDKINAMRERALKAEHMESTTKKITLHPEDLARAEQTPVQAISLIPSVNLDEATLIQRFGQPAEKIQLSETLTHYLYPAKGLDIVLDTKGKELLQYVQPGEFESRIRAPLLARKKEAAPAK